MGSDADLVLWDFETSRNINNEILHANPLITICGGEIVWRNGKFCSNEVENSVKADVKNSNQKRSLFLSLAPNSPYLFSVVQLREKVHFLILFPLICL